MTTILITSDGATNALGTNPSTPFSSSTGGFGSTEFKVATSTTGLFGTAASVAPATGGLFGTTTAKPSGLGNKPK